MYAIIEDSGTQVRASVGDTLVLDIRALPEDAKSVTFDRVLMIGGDKAKFGMPYVTGASVTAEIVEREFKGEKLDVIKFRRRKNYRRKIGHRQRYMKVKVTAINA